MRPLAYSTLNTEDNYDFYTELKVEGAGYSANLVESGVFCTSGVLVIYLSALITAATRS